MSPSNSAGPVAGTAAGVPVAKLSVMKSVDGNVASALGNSTRIATRSGSGMTAASTATVTTCASSPCARMSPVVCLLNEAEAADGGGMDDIVISDNVVNDSDMVDVDDMVELV